MRHEVFRNRAHQTSLFFDRLYVLIIQNFLQERRIILSSKIYSNQVSRIPNRILDRKRSIATKFDKMNESLHLSKPVFGKEADLD